MRKSILILAAAAAVAGCATSEAAPPPAANPEGGSCSNAGLESYVGQPYTPTLGTEMQTRSGAGSLRVVNHGEMVTMEFNGNRLTVMLDAQNRVATVRCG